MVGDDPDQQVAATIDLMAKYVREDAHSPEVKSVAGSLAPPDASPDEILNAAFLYVRGLVRFQQDETTAQPLQSRIAAAGLDGYPVVEVLIRPRDMVTWRGEGYGQPAGDCDDFSMLTAALLMARGVKVNFATAAADGRVPGQWSHVYVVAYPGGGERVPMDTSHGQAPGWEAQGASVTRREEWPITSGFREILVAGVIVAVVLANCWKRLRRGRTL